MQRTDFHFELPEELIAQHPAPVRSGSRMLALDGNSGVRRDLLFRDLPALLSAGDLLVFNDTRVVPARAHGIKESGGKIEILLERVLDATTALVHARASKGLKPQARVMLPGGVTAHMMDRDGDLFRLRFSHDVLAFFEEHGEMPLPPYVNRAPDPADRERYQTVYARESGAVAAPTAGLHFDADTFAALEARGIGRAFVTLHVGAGTFQPVRVDNIEEHRMHEEQVEVSSDAVEQIHATRAAGRKVIAVGTTVVRCLETAAAAAADAAPGATTRVLLPYRGPTQIFIKPGHRFRAVDAMLTNFHLPESTLLMLCAAFVGRELLLSAYAHAVTERYRFFSYGDAMFLTPAHSSVSEARA